RPSSELEGRNTGKQQDSAAVGFGFHRLAEAPPTRCSHHLSRPSFGAQIGCKDREVWKAAEPTQGAAFRIKSSTGRLAGANAQLEETKGFLRDLEDPGSHRGVEHPFRMAAPAIEDIVIVPDHQRRHSSQQPGSRRLCIDLTVAVQVKIKGRLAHLLGKGLALFAALRGLAPSKKCRMAFPYRIRIELISPVQHE